MTENTVKPDELAMVEVGRIAEPYGVKGWVNVIPFSDDPVALMRAKQWSVCRPKKQLNQAGGALQFEAAIEYAVMNKKQHSDRIVAQFMGFEDRTAAESLKGSLILLPRSAFPKTDEGEYYWVDLVGCSAVNRQGQTIGLVAEVVDHGAHAIVVLTADGATGHKAEEEILIPFVPAYIDKVDIQARRIEVDWEHDFT